MIKAKKQTFSKCIEIGITTTYQTLNADCFGKCLALNISIAIFSIWAYLLFYKFNVNFCLFIIAKLNMFKQHVINARFKRLLSGFVIS